MKKYNTIFVCIILITFFVGCATLLPQSTPFPEISQEDLYGSWVNQNGMIWTISKNRIEAVIYDGSWSADIISWTEIRRSTHDTYPNGFIITFTRIEVQGSISRDHVPNEQILLINRDKTDFITRSNMVYNRYKQ